MNKAELKRLLKPLIKECIKEVIFEDGVLSGIVSEVATGISANVPLVETRSAPPLHEKKFGALRQQSLNEQKEKIDEHRKKLLDAVGTNAYNGVNLFEGTAPLTGPGPKPGSSPAPQGPLTGMAPGDAGVDISNLFGTVGSNWKAHMGSGK
jgi:hypothetical protein